MQNIYTKQLILQLPWLILHFPCLKSFIVLHFWPQLSQLFWSDLLLVVISFWLCIAVMFLPMSSSVFVIQLKVIMCTLAFLFHPFSSLALSAVFPSENDRSSISDLNLPSSPTVRTVGRKDHFSAWLLCILLFPKMDCSLFTTGTAFVLKAPEEEGSSSGF